MYAKTLCSFIYNNIACLSDIHSSIIWKHLSLSGSWRGLELIPADIGRRRGTHWISHQFITGQTYRNKQLFTPRFTPTDIFAVMDKPDFLHIFEIIPCPNTPDPKKLGRCQASADDEHHFNQVCWSRETSKNMPGTGHHDEDRKTPTSSLSFEPIMLNETASKQQQIETFRIKAQSSSDTATDAQHSLSLRTLALHLLLWYAPNAKDGLGM